MKRPVWKKLGLVFRPSGNLPWMQSHASTPAAEVLHHTLVRVYFTSRDAQNRSHIGCLELDVRKPLTVRRGPSGPLVTPGESGAFDQDGVAMGCVVQDGSRRLLYYVGWALHPDVPWRNTIGLAVADGDSLRFEKLATPVLGLGPSDPHSLSYPWVLREASLWRMWYGSNLEWGATPETMRHVVKYAESHDGKRWQRDGRVAIPLRAEELAVARPCVVRDADRYRMWYSRRSPGYRIGYAESADGSTWTRLDESAAIDPSPGDWDGGSVEYPCVFDAGGNRYMLYNGDDYGRAGFGLAILE